MSQRYEVMVVVRPELGEAGVKEQIDRAQRILHEQDAKEIRIHDWGQRDLAYRIDSCRRGWYYLIEYDGEAKAVNELERNLRLSDQILRFLTVRQEHEVRVPSHEGSEEESRSSSRGDASDSSDEKKEEGDS